MIYGTHTEIGMNTWEFLIDKDRDILDKKSFLLGNVLPDTHPNYRVRKHRLKQFEGKVSKKIEYLSSLDYNSFNNEITIKKFSRELGIVCHFLSDFFCMPHSEWGVKESLNLKHVRYEKELHKRMEEHSPIKEYYYISSHEEYKKFLKISLCKYKATANYENDLYYSMYVCNSVTKYILSSIHMNSEKTKKNKNIG